MVKKLLLNPLAWGFGLFALVAVLWLIEASGRTTPFLWFYVVLAFMLISGFLLVRAAWRYVTRSH